MSILTDGIKLPGSNEEIPVPLIIGGGVIIVAFIVWQRSQAAPAQTAAPTDASGLLSTELDQRMNDLWNQVFAVIKQNTGTTQTQTPTDSNTTTDNTTTPTGETYGMKGEVQDDLGRYIQPVTPENSLTITNPGTPASGNTTNDIVGMKSEIINPGGNLYVAAGGPYPSSSAPALARAPRNRDNGPMIDDNGRDVSALKRIGAAPLDLSKAARSAAPLSLGYGSEGVPLSRYGSSPAYMGNSPMGAPLSPLPGGQMDTAYINKIHPGLEGNEYPALIARQRPAPGLGQFVPTAPGASPFPDISMNSGASLMEWTGSK